MRTRVAFCAPYGYERPRTALQAPFWSGVNPFVTLRCSWSLRSPAHVRPGWLRLDPYHIFLDGRSSANSRGRRQYRAGPHTRRAKSTRIGELDCANIRLTSRSNTPTNSCPRLPSTQTSRTERVHNMTWIRGLCNRRRHSSSHPKHANARCLRQLWLASQEALPRSGTPYLPSAPQPLGLDRRESAMPSRRLSQGLHEPSIDIPFPSRDRVPDHHAKPIHLPAAAIMLWTHCPPNGLRTGHHWASVHTNHLMASRWSSQASWSVTPLFNGLLPTLIVDVEFTKPHACARSVGPNGLLSSSQLGHGSESGPIHFRDSYDPSRRPKTLG